MRIALVSTYTHPFALGLRYLSSYLKTAGHEVTLLLMSSRRDTARPDYTPAVLADYVDQLRSADLIGLSLMTNTFHRAVALTETIRAAGLRAPVIWGGTHPTVAPEESLEHADVICIGEGEEPLLQLVEHIGRGQDPTHLGSLWFRAGGPFGNRATVRNAIAPLPADLDALPLPDWELDTHWVVGRDGLVRARPDNLRGALDTLRMITARGCPYHCAFCNNAALRNVHKQAGRWVRLRSLDHVLGEIRHALASFPTIRSVNFVDDLFLVRGEEELEEFATRYTAEFDRPLQLDAFPNTVTERKVAALARLPIELVSLGIESASADTLERIYQRPSPPARIAAAIDLLHRHRIRTEYHYIVSNPYEPEANVIETLRLAATYHRGPSVLRVFPLMFYPGTPLYEQARRDGRIAGRDHGAYDFMGTGALELARHDYLAIWLRCVLNLRNIGVPSWICHRVIDVATARPARALLERRWFGPTVFYTYHVARKLARNLIYQPLVKPWTYLSRRRRRRAAAGVPWRLPSVDVAAMRHRPPVARCVPAEDVAMPPDAAAPGVAPTTVPAGAPPRSAARGGGR
jgi:anaerobic magnesium-protoporphyrin IX monomethyl ester cyclase